MSDGPFLIGIGGGTGAGKTTIAMEVADAVDADVTLLSLDNYYRPQSAVPRDEDGDTNFDHPDAIDWDLVTDHVGALAAGEGVAVPDYDFETHARTGEHTAVDPAPIVVLEGIFALYHEAVLEALDVAVYVQTDADVRALRRLRRDVDERGRTVEGVIDQYLSTVKPMHEQFVEPTKRSADVIIPEGANPVALDLLAEKVEQETESRSGRSTTER